MKHCGKNAPRTFILLLAILMGLIVSSCSNLKHPSFDEAKWRRDVAATDASLVYAPHFLDGKFFNPWMPMGNRGFVGFLKWKFSRADAYSDEEELYHPNVIPDLKARILSMGGEDFIAWVGHATFLMRLNGEFWITDPMLSNRALWPKRKTPPAITAEELASLPGRLNVIISHNHYDHLDAKTIRKLPADARIYAPLGLREFLKELHAGEIEELDWWQTVDCGNGVKLACLPTQHWSRRIGQPLNTTLWASFLLASENNSVYYGGDSGYFKGYKEIGAKFAGIKYALLPVGANHPRWFMHYAHMDVEEVLDAFEDLGAGYLIPTQWGTFRLGDEPIGYPALDLKRRIGKRRMDASRLLILDIGQIVPAR